MINFVKMGKYVQKHKKIFHEGDLIPVNDFQDKFMEAEVFVIQIKRLQQIGIENGDFLPVVEHDSIAAMPFSVIAIEMEEGRSCLELTINNNKDGKLKKSKMMIYSILAIEKPNLDLKFYVYFEDDLVDQQGVFVFERRDKMTAYDTIYSFVKLVIDVIHKSNEGFETVKKHINIGTAKKKKVKKISRVIHITDKKYASEVKSSQPGRSIDWSHRWLVRGHWRKIKGKGKNRQGEKNVIEGRTFVVPHEKGKGELVHKTRVCN